MGGKHGKLTPEKRASSSYYPKTSRDVVNSAVSSPIPEHCSNNDIYNYTGAPYTPAAGTYLGYPGNDTAHHGNFTHGHSNHNGAIYNSTVTPNSFATPTGNIVRGDGRPLSTPPQPITVEQLRASIRRARKAAVNKTQGALFGHGHRLEVQPRVLSCGPPKQPPPPPPPGPPLQPPPLPPPGPPLQPPPPPPPGPPLQPPPPLPASFLLPPEPRPAPPPRPRPWIRPPAKPMAPFPPSTPQQQHSLPRPLQHATKQQVATQAPSRSKPPAIPPRSIISNAHFSGPLISHPTSTQPQASSVSLSKPATHPLVAVPFSNSIPATGDWVVVNTSNKMEETSLNAPEINTATKINCPTLPRSDTNKYENEATRRHGSSRTPLEEKTCSSTYTSEAKLQTPYYDITISSLSPATQQPSSVIQHCSPDNTKSSGTSHTPKWIACGTTITGVFSESDEEITEEFTDKSCDCYGVNEDSTDVYIITRVEGSVASVTEGSGSASSGHGAGHTSLTPTTTSHNSRDKTFFYSDNTSSGSDSNKRSDNITRQFNNTNRQCMKAGCLCAVCLNIPTIMSELSSLKKCTKQENVIARSEERPQTAKPSALKQSNETSRCAESTKAVKLQAQPSSSAEQSTFPNDVSEQCIKEPKIPSKIKDNVERSTVRKAKTYIQVTENNHNKQNVLKKKRKTKKSLNSVTNALIKPTTLYIKFGEVIGEHTDIFDYMYNRLSAHLEFTVEQQEIDHDAQNTIVTVLCRSKRTAQRLQVELQKANNESHTKMYCFHDMQEARGLRVVPHEKVEESFENHQMQMTKRAQFVLGLHYVKISKLELQLNALKQEQCNKSICIQKAGCLATLRRALEDKLKELNLQKDEFKTYLKSALQTLQNYKNSKNFESVADDTRLKLAVECKRLFNTFPIYARRSDIVSTVKAHQVSVVIGETGSGKSTQMTQYLHEAGFSRTGLIACTQPRKIAATSLATHVAREMGACVGQLVGYKVGLQTRKSALTKILYMTDHVLLNECLQDPLLSNFSCIIIDEAHERSIYTDLLLGMIKQCLKERPDLRLIITSATINPTVFVNYFHKCPVLFVSGRMFPVEVEWQKPEAGVDSFDNYQEKAVKKAVLVHLTEEEGDILVFLTSPLETEKACERFQDLMEGRARNYITMQLHGKLQGEEQQRVFDPPSLGKRKVVFATNSAETSVTIPGIKYVVDSGLVKEMKFDAVRKMSTLSVTMVTQSSAKQRLGRAGRLGPGKCFRLYTESDFKKMEANTLPELMRVHIGHAMLKLMELGVDPMVFDYIESPSAEAMEEAMASLEHLGAVSQKKITDLGKWISKMPFEPRYGALVYEGVKLGVGVEAIVVAAASGTNSVFYRCGSNEEKEKADRQKIPFCHEAGDQLTVLNVFREWHKVEERDKGKWCAKHYINGKSIKGIRETTSEVLHTLKKEMSIDITFSFKQASNVDGKLASLLFKALERNLSYFLGHKKAGYLVVRQEQRVEPHPSCALLSLAGQPQWVVFDQVMRTTRDFAMQITPVPEGEVLQAIRDGWLQLDVEQVRKKCITVMCQETVGLQLFREVVGPRYTDLRSLETQLAARCGQSVVVVEADAEKGCLQVLSTEKNVAKLYDSFTPIVPPLRTKFALEESEERLGSVTVDAGVRAVIGAGGSVLSIFMPEEYKAILVFCSLTDYEEMLTEDVLKEFGQFGAIKDCQKFYPKKQTSLWGKIIYESPEFAIRAVEAKLQSPEANTWARPTSRAANNQAQGFRTKIQWCRRASKGFGFVDFANIEDYMVASRENVIFVGGVPAKIKVARNSPQSVHVAGLSMLANEDVLRDAFAGEFNIDPVKDIKKVSIIRERVDLNKEMFDTCKRRLISKIKEFVDAKNFRLEMRELRSEKDVNFVAFCSFTNPEDGHLACSNIHNIFSLNGRVVSMKADIHSSMFIHRDIFRMSGDEVKKQLEALESNAMRIKIKQLKNENVVLDLQTESAAALAQARASIQAIICGDVMECHNSQAALTLFSRDGRKKLQQVMARTETLIITDNRLMCISFHGAQRNRQAARAAVDEHLEQLSLGNYRDVELKGGGRPPGVMKALMLQFGTDLGGLVAETNAGAVRLDHKNHRLRIFGSQEAVSRTVDIVDEVINTLAVDGKVNVNDDAPDCVICFCPVEVGEMYRVECCGHAYCRECMQAQLDTAVADKNFPLVCGQDGCGTQFVWRDLVNLSRRGQVTLARLVEASVGHYVAQHQDRYHYCTTPDCPIIYRSSSSGSLFSCPECGTRICTSCHVQYHDGISCAMFRSLGRDASLQEWLSQDQGNRKKCPNCTTPIEKDGGCNKVTCSTCKKHICWVCLATFDHINMCYGHMSADHGSFY